MKTSLIIVVLLSLAVTPGCSRKTESSNQPAKARSDDSAIAHQCPRLRPIEQSHFQGPDCAWIVAGSGDLLRTTDGGANWQEFQIGTEAENAGYAYELTFLDNHHGWSLDLNGDIRRTFDGGNTWALVPGDRPSQLLYEIKFTSEMSGWIDAIFSMWRTTDGGTTWSNHEFPRPLGALYFLDDNTGWACSQSDLGLNAVIYRTTDGGDTWDSIEIENTSRTDEADSADIRDIFFLNAQQGWMADRHSLRRTLDGGTTWQAIKLETENVILDSVWFPNKEEGWVAGLVDIDASENEFEGVVFRTTDGGHSWQRVNVGEENLGFDKVYFSDAQHGWLTGVDRNESRIYRTTDGGQTWEMVLKVSEP